MKALHLQVEEIKEVEINWVCAEFETAENSWNSVAVDEEKKGKGMSNAFCS